MEKKFIKYSKKEIEKFAKDYVNSSYYPFELEKDEEGLFGRKSSIQQVIKNVEEIPINFEVEKELVFSPEVPEKKKNKILNNSCFKEVFELYKNKKISDFWDYWKSLSFRKKIEFYQKYVRYMVRKEMGFINY